VIAGDPVHPRRGGLHPAEDVAAADDEGELDTEPVDGGQLVGEDADDFRVDPEAPGAHERLAGEFEQDPPEPQAVPVAHRR